MESIDRTKLAAFSAVVALAALLIAIVSAHALFPQLLFYGIVLTLMGIIVVLVVYAFLARPLKNYVGIKLWTRSMNQLSRNHFDDFLDFVQRFNSFQEFRNPKQGAIRILEDLIKKAVKGEGAIIQMRISDFVPTLKNPLSIFHQRANSLRWNKGKINYEFLESLVKEFENYVALHKRLYVDYTVLTARQIGHGKLSDTTKRLYTEYKDNYNDFTVAYSEFAKRSSKAGLRIFNESLDKANAL